MAHWLDAIASLAIDNLETRIMARKRRNKNHKATQKPSLAKTKGKLPAKGAKGKSLKEQAKDFMDSNKKTKGSNQTGYGGQSFYSFKKDCHGSTLQNAFDIGGVKIWLGAKSDFRMHEITRAGGWTLAINLSGLGAMQSDATLEPNESARQILPADLLEQAHSLPELAVDWPDGGMPLALPDSWYHRLAAWIREQESGNVVICCMGGHGRTGTLAVLLAGLSGLIPVNECPVAWLRNLYCEEAIETSRQVKAIERILERRIWEAGAWETGFFGWEDQNIEKGTGNDPKANITGATIARQWEERNGSATGAKGTALVPKGVGIGATHKWNDKGVLVPIIDSQEPKKIRRGESCKEEVFKALERVDPTGADWADLLQTQLDQAYEKSDWELAAIIEESLSDLIISESGTGAHFSDLVPYGRKEEESK